MSRRPKQLRFATLAVWLSATVTGLAGFGCVTSVRIAELPPHPIAVAYLDPEQVRRNHEAAQERNALFELQRRAAVGEGVARIRDVSRFLEERFGGAGTASALGDPRRGFRREPDRNSPRLALLDPVTGDLELVRSARLGSLPAAWSADRERLLFSQIVRGYAQLFELSLASGEVRPITREPRAHPWGCYGPEGRFVVASVDYGERPPLRRIEVSDPTGHRLQLLSQGTGGGDSRPACAPDGSAIAYVKGIGREAQVVVRSPVLEGRPRVVARGIDPSFTRDSKVIVYAGVARKIRRANRVDDLWRIRRTRVHGTGRGAFPDGPLSEYEPAVSSDGKLIAYVGVDENLNRVLYVRRMDGSGERMLFNDGAALGPIW